MNRIGNLKNRGAILFGIGIALMFVTIGAATLFAGGNGEPESIVAYEAPPRESRAQEVTPLPSGVSAMEALQNQFRVVSQQVLPVVVEINVVDVIQQRVPQVSSPFEFFFGPRDSEEGDEDSQLREYRQQGLGSGVIVGRSENTVYVLTNDHVVGKADEISAKLYDGREFEATIIGADSRKDLALISFETEEEVPIAILGDSDSLMVGDWVFAVGNPLGFESTVTSGIVSALARQPDRLQNYTDYIQTDAAINQGNSGGALVNLYGEVVGINTWIASNSGGNIGLGFAIPINTAKEAIEDFIESGAIEYGWLGITVGTLNDQAKEELGYEAYDGGFVYNIVKGSPAEEAGLQPGDLVTRIGDEAILDSRELTAVVGNLGPGSTRTFTVQRFGNTLEIEVTLGIRDEEKIEAGSGDLWPGIAVVTLTDEMRERANVPDDAGNVVIAQVDTESPADIAGLRGGDVIKELDGEPLAGMRDFYEVLNSSSGRRVEFTLYRRGSEITIGMAR